MISISAFKSFPEIPELALQNGLKLEFSGLVEPIHYSDELIQTVTKSKYYELYNSAHGPFFDLIPPSSDIEVSELAKSKFIRAINACERLNIKNIILHSGWIPNFYTNEKWVNNSIRFWTYLIENTPKEINICLENVMETSPDLMFEIANGINNPRFSICLDIGHVNVFCNGEINKWLKKLNDTIGHIHLHNNFGKEDNHFGLKKGIIDIEKVYSNIKEYCNKATINLEIRSDIIESIKMIKNIEEKIV